MDDKISISFQAVRPLFSGSRVERCIDRSSMMSDHRRRDEFKDREQRGKEGGMIEGNQIVQPTKPGGLNTEIP